MRGRGPDSCGKNTDIRLLCSNNTSHTVVECTASHSVQKEVHYMGQSTLKISQTPMCWPLCSVSSHDWSDLDGR